MKVLFDIGKIRVMKIGNSAGKFSGTFTYCSDRHCILYVVDGEGTCIIEGYVMAFREKTSLLFNPITYFGIKIDPDVKFNAILIEFQSSELTLGVPEILKKMMTKDGKDKLYEYKETEKRIRAIYDQLAFVAAMSEEQKRSYLTLLVSQLVILISSMDDMSEELENYELGTRVMEYLNNNYLWKKVNLTWVAKRFFVSKYYLCRAFKKHNLITVHGYISYKKIAYARQLIANGMSTLDAAYKIGYGDYSSFYRAFVKAVGKSPSR